MSLVDDAKAVEVLTDKVQALLDVILLLRGGHLPVELIERFEARDPVSGPASPLVTPPLQAVAPRRSLTGDLRAGLGSPSSLD